MGHFVLDEVTEDGLEKKMREEVVTSLSQARKSAKDVQRAKSKTYKNAAAA